jgi:hypothetical protein
MVHDEPPPKQRRPSAGANPAIGVRMPPDELDAVDDWRRGQPDLPSRPEAIRRLVSRALAAEGQPTRQELATGYIVGDQLTSENDGGASR